ncbi:hypothetical protein CBOM_07801 [Ceraceosorus bombacis]|uniref:Uncharacterized protein n=1 Tax=Ceraceosorus bombacis TaxID=401625 RepID=A0A0P1BMC1_9BASI|nr:hypothetical protein CBOM_07801 [Ceraceosorus bombacis]
MTFKIGSGTRNDDMSALALRAEVSRKGYSPKAANPPARLSFSFSHLLTPQDLLPSCIPRVCVERAKALTCAVRVSVGWPSCCQRDHFVGGFGLL